MKWHVRVAGVLCLALLLAAPIAMAGKARTLSLRTSDGVTVYGTLTWAPVEHNAIALLFHEGGANRHEYDPLLPVLHKLGYDTLAIDQRSGGDRFGGQNETVDRRGFSSGDFAALPDLQAALGWAHAFGYGRIVAVGSSYSASLVLLLASRHPPGLTAVAGFSPARYVGGTNRMEHAVARITLPLYITADPQEEGNVDTLLHDAHGANITRYRPEVGVHGASTLVCSRDPRGCKANLRSFADFLRRVGP